MSNKDWKDHLLSSGLPLEYSVVQCLRQLGVERPKEYRYERTNEYGIPTIFSVDVHATVIGRVWLEFFIECKYRHDATRWIFTPDEYGNWLDEGFHDAFIALDQLTEEYIDSRHIDGYAAKYGLCGKGIELLANDKNPKSIEQCVQQLRFALVEQAVEGLIHQVQELLGKPNPIFVLIPIIVTTAELWRLRPGVTIEDVRGAKDLPEVADVHDCLVLKQPPDNQLSRHTMLRFKHRLSDTDKCEFEKRNRGSPVGYTNFVSGFSTHYPSLFFVVHYGYLKSALQDLLSIFKNPSLDERADRRHLKPRRLDHTS
jgi:hypothetical protein